MTFAEILEKDRLFPDYIILYQEGMFYKAYERSAFLVYNYIFPFKLSKKFVKVVGQDVISLGFPIKTLPKWMAGREQRLAPDGLAVYSKAKAKEEFTDDEFNNWKETVEVNISKRYTPNTATIQKTPLYKKCYDLVVEIYCVSRNFSKHVREPLGVTLKAKTYELSYFIRFYYETPNDDKNAWVKKALMDVREIEFILQLLKDLREINLSHYCKCSEILASVSKQLELLHQKVMAKVDVV